MCAGMVPVSADQFTGTGVAGATVVPTGTTPQGTLNGSPTGNGHLLGSLFRQPTRKSGMKDREQLRQNMFDPDKEEEVLCSCF